MSLNKDDFARLIDYVGGYGDLKSKTIKVLHDKSFVDDPTRIIRALKYSARLGFNLDCETLKLQQDYLKKVNYDMCTKRVKNELMKTFNQSSDVAQVAFERFLNQDIYKLITQNEVQKPKENIIELIDEFQPTYKWLIYFGVVAAFESDEFLDKFELTKTEKAVIVNAKRILDLKLSDDFSLYKAFYSVSIETSLIVAALGKKKDVVHYLNDLQKIKLSITGRDLLSLGMAPSKAFSDGFDYVLGEKIKNPHLLKDEELELIKNYLNQS